MIFASAVTSGHLPARYAPLQLFHPPVCALTLLSLLPPLRSTLLPSLASCNPLRSAGACAFPAFRRTFRVHELLIGYRPFLFFPQRHPRGSTRARIEGYGRARIVDCVLFTRSTQGRSIAPRMSR